MDVGPICFAPFRHAIRKLSMRNVELAYAAQTQSSKGCIDLKGNQTDKKNNFMVSWMKMDDLYDHDVLVYSRCDFCVSNKWRFLYFIIGSNKLLESSFLLQWEQEELLDCSFFCFFLLFNCFCSFSGRGITFLIDGRVEKSHHPYRKLIVLAKFVTTATHVHLL